MPNETRPRKLSLHLLLLIGLLLGLMGIALFVSKIFLHRRVNVPSPFASSLQFYALKTGHRQALAEWQALRHAPHAGTLQNWVEQHYVIFQSMGLRWVELATCNFVQDRTVRAGAQLDSARFVGQALAEMVNDSFLLKLVYRVEKLDQKSLQLRAKASALYVQAYDRNNPQALQDCEEAVRLAEQADDDKISIEALCYLAYLYEDKSSSDSVIKINQKLIARAEKAGYHRRLAIALRQLAYVYAVNLNQDSTAMALLQRAIPLAERLHDQAELINCYYEQAEIYKARADYEQAETTLEKLLRLDSQNGRAHLLQGRLDIVRGEYDKARQQFHLALHAFRQIAPDSENVAVALNRLAVLNRLVGDYENALQCEQQALAIRQEFNQAEQMAESLSHLGMIYAKMDSLEKAIALLQKALKHFKSNRRLSIANTWLGLGEAQLKKGDLEGAAESFAQAQALAYEIKQQILKMESRLGHAEVALQKAQLAQADSHFTSVFDSAQRLREPSLSAAAMFGLSKTAQRLHRLNRALELIEKAIATVETLRANLRPDTIRASYFATTQEFFDQAILLASAHGDEALALRYAERARARALRDALDQNTIARLQEKKATIVMAPVPAMRVLQQNMPDAAQCVAYRVTPDSLFIWVVERQRLSTRRVAASARQLEREVQKFLLNIGALDLSAFDARCEKDLPAVYQENRALGHQLYQRLWKPIAEFIAPEKQLYIIPDGVLHRLPFGALVTDEQLFFDEHYVWAKIPSLAILAENPTAPKTPSLSQMDFLMIASDLPSVNAQKKRLAGLFKNFSLLEKPEATYAALQHRLQAGSDIVYFSVHAMANAHYPLDSYIELYANDGANGAWQKTPIYARQLLALDFSKTLLAVLNACETSSGKIMHGEGILNIVRIFWLAQVPHVVASLWQNDDRYSAVLTNYFFQEIQRGQNFARALHNAKLHLLDALHTEYEGAALPYFWSVFELYQTQW